MKIIQIRFFLSAINKTRIWQKGKPSARSYAAVKEPEIQKRGDRFGHVLTERKRKEIKETKE